MKAILCLLLLCSLAPFAAAQVQLGLSAETAGLAARGNFTAKLTVKIVSGWHISSLTQPDGGPVRTEIFLGQGQPFKIVGRILGDKPQVMRSNAFDADVEFYTGSVHFTLPIAVTEEFKPGTKLTVQVTYQACNEETCLFSKTETVSCLIDEAKRAAGQDNGGSTEKGP